MMMTLQNATQPTIRYYTFGEGLHQRLLRLDDTGTAYSIMVDDGEELDVVEHGPNFIVAVPSGCSAMTGSIFINLANVKTLEVVEHG